MITTNDSGEDVVKQTRRGNQLIDLSVPECVARYNKSMGGVDCNVMLLCIHVSW